MTPLLLQLVLVPNVLAVVPTRLGDLVITEIQADPVTKAQYYAEWFELYNNSGKTLDLNDIVITRDGQSFTIEGPPITVGVEDYVVLGVSSDTSINGNVAIDYVYSFADFNVEAPDDTITLTYGAITLDELDWDSSWSFVADNAHSCAPNASANEWANGLSLNWCPSQVFISGSGMYGSPGAENEYCGEEPNVDNDGDGYAEFEGDCDDDDKEINPDATDGSSDPYGNPDDDADCDGVRDDGDSDDDGDGWTEVAGDCNDDDINTYPGAIETLDGEDDDCDGCADDVDNDRDNWTSCPEECDSDDDGDIDSADVPCFDCDDAQASYNPDAVETPYDDVDQDCDGYDACDEDGDGYEADSTYGAGVCGGYDCDEGNPDVHPGAPEDPSNGLDDDCDGYIDIPDRDGDGYTEQDGDCMDLGAEDGYSAERLGVSAGANPGASEICFNQVDDDCDGWIDNGADCSSAAQFAGVRGGGLCGVVDGAAGLAGMLGGLAAAAARRTRANRRSA